MTTEKFNELRILQAEFLEKAKSILDEKDSQFVSVKIIVDNVSSSDEVWRDQPFDVGYRGDVYFFSNLDYRVQISSNNMTCSKKRNIAK